MMRTGCTKLFWALVLGLLSIPGAGKVAAQQAAMASNSAIVQTTGPEAGSNGLAFLDIIGRGNTFSTGGPSYGVVEFNSGDLGLGQVSQVNSVTLRLPQTLFGASSRGSLEFYVTDDTTTSILNDGSSPLIFDMSDVHGLNGQLANLYDLGAGKFHLVRNGYVNVYMLAIADPNLESYLVNQINSGGTLRFVIAPNANHAGHEKVGGSFGGWANANMDLIPTLTVQ